MKSKWFVLGAILLSTAGAALWPGGILEGAPPKRYCNLAWNVISSPQAGDVVSGQVAIQGSASLPGTEFRYYKVEFSAVGTNNWAVVVDRARTQVINGTLAVMNTDLLPEGDYTIRVLAVDPTANYCEAFASPIHINHTAPPATDIPQLTPMPNGNGTPNALGQAQVVTPRPPLVLEVPTLVPGTDALMTRGKGLGSSLPAPSVDLNTMSATVGDWVGSIGRSFFFGMQFTAGLFLLIGAIAFLRRNL